ncbi:VanZ family protein [Microbacterium sp. CH12i]|uniref:VanZ family protein n=1 Tax=Microbacterium sp. CH12i TaxID=1479651 RepID=UPI0004618672|nr:VanZ family protein [Microbacterium sp. CH12i]KDA04883.1 VanZ family protein [Microbacterium sp. CH12i]
MRSRGRLWVVAGLAVYALAVVAVLVLPVPYAGIVRGIGQALTSTGISGFGTGWIEFVANVLMFAPLGFFLTLLFRHPLVGTVVALVLSVTAEVVQIVIPSRQPSLRDIVANVFGAALGAFLAWLIVLRRRKRRT